MQISDVQLLQSASQPTNSHVEHATCYHPGRIHESASVNRPRVQRFHEERIDSTFCTGCLSSLRGCLPKHKWRDVVQDFPLIVTVPTFTYCRHTKPTARKDI